MSSGRYYRVTPVAPTAGSRSLGQEGRICRAEAIVRSHSRDDRNYRQFISKNPPPTHAARRVFPPFDARNPLERRFIDLSDFRGRRPRRAPAGGVHAGGRTVVRRSVAARVRDLGASQDSGHCPVPGDPQGEKDAGCARVLESERNRTGRGAGSEKGISGPRRHHRRRPGSLYDAWAGRSDRRQGLCAERCERRSAGASGTLTCRCRRRCGRAFGHDGWAHRGDPQRI